VTPGAGAAHFCSARALAPTIVFPDEAVAPDLKVWWDRPCTPSPSERVARGPWVVDGSRVDRTIPARPDLQPYLFQQLREDGRVERSVVVSPGMAMPALDVPDWYAAPYASERERPDVAAWSLAAAGAVGATLGGVLVWQATVYAPGRYGAALTDEGFASWRDEVLVPHRDAGYALIGVGSAAAAGAVVAFAL
jgi:hypothetical protein